MWKNLGDLWLCGYHKSGDPLIKPDVFFYYGRQHSYLFSITMGREIHLESLYGLVTMNRVTHWNMIAGATLKGHFSSQWTTYAGTKNLIPKRSILEADLFLYIHTEKYLGVMVIELWTIELTSGQILTFQAIPKHGMFVQPLTLQHQRDQAIFNMFDWSIICKKNNNNNTHSCGLTRSIDLWKNVKFTRLCRLVIPFILLSLMLWLWVQCRINAVQCIILTTHKAILFYSSIVTHSLAQFELFSLCTAGYRAILSHPI